MLAITEWRFHGNSIPAMSASTSQNRTLMQKPRNGIAAVGQTKKRGAEAPLFVVSPCGSEVEVVTQNQLVLATERAVRPRIEVEILISERRYLVTGIDQVAMQRGAAPVEQERVVKIDGCPRINGLVESLIQRLIVVVRVDVTYDDFAAVVFID